MVPDQNKKRDHRPNLAPWLLLANVLLNVARVVIDLLRS
jgi:hypothetical protein